ncbi:MAG TPA: PDZ domain-containing protein [Actinomycetota bacterium]|nr:PDZ domain-containing protein [Actinomycetota bacterium]
MARRDSDLPEPPVAPVRGRSRARVWTVAVAIVVAAAAYVVPLPGYFGLVPGPVRDVEDLVEVTGARTYSSEGSLFLTTVRIDPNVTFFDAVAYGVDPTKSVVPRDAVTGGQSGDAFDRRQEAEMAASQRAAELVALSAAGLAEPAGDSVGVAGTLPGTGGARVLEEGDEIVSFDGRRVTSNCELTTAVQRRSPGDRVEVVVRRDGGTERFDVALGTDPRGGGGPILGVVMQPSDMDVEGDLEVGFDIGEIGGPSAGLVFALTLYDRVTPDDLTGGRAVAGTGTITECGDVGEIGSIESKVAGAEARGAELFLAPASQAAAARAVADDIEVVPVETFEDAVRHLQDRA